MDDDDDDEEEEDTANNRTDVGKEGEAHIDIGKGDVEAGDASGIGASDEAEVEYDDSRDANIDKAKGETIVNRGDAIGSEDDADTGECIGGTCAYKSPCHASGMSFGKW